MDDRIRKLERLAKQGDLEAQTTLNQYLLRARQTQWDVVFGPWSILAEEGFSYIQEIHRPLYLDSTKKNKKKYTYPRSLRWLWKHWVRTKELVFIRYQNRYRYDGCLIALLDKPLSVFVVEWVSESVFRDEVKRKPTYVALPLTFITSDAEILEDGIICKEWPGVV